MLNALDAIEHGGRVHVHSTVESITRAPGDGRLHGGAPLRGLRAGPHDQERLRVRARVVVNATGAWAPITAALGRLSQARVRVRPGKGIHVVLDRRSPTTAIVSEAIDGRQIFLYPGRT